MSEQPQDQKPIVFGGKELDPDEERAYLERVQAARRTGGVRSLKGTEPIGVVPRPAVPSLQRELPDVPSSGGGVTPRPAGSPLLSPQTAHMLQEAADASVKQAQAAKKEEEKKEEEKKTEDLFEMFDFQGRDEASRILNNKKRREAIEARCASMSVEDLILRDEVKQVVPIIPGQFEITFRSMTPEENLFIKRYIASKDTGQSDQYITEKFGILQLVCCVFAINNRPLPDHRNEKGEVDEKLFEAKLALLLKKSGYVIADLGINYYWFDIRVRRLLNPDALGNG